MRWLLALLFLGLFQMLGFGHAALRQDAFEFREV
jgi:hypothetical protein